MIFGDRDLRYEKAIDVVSVDKKYDYIKTIFQKITSIISDEDEFILATIF